MYRNGYKSQLKGFDLSKINNNKYVQATQKIICHGFFPFYDHLSYDYIVLFIPIRMI